MKIVGMVVDRLGTRLAPRPLDPLSNYLDNDGRRCTGIDGDKSCYLRRFVPSYCMIAAPSSTLVRDPRSRARRQTRLRPEGAREDF